MPNLAWEDPLPPRILIIDDNPSVHAAFDEILRRGPVNESLEKEEVFMFGAPHPLRAIKPAYQTAHALSGAEGVEKVRLAVAAGTPYPVAFVDIRMPGMDGVETIERVWELDFQIQTVICTAYADYRWEDLAKRLGQTDRLLVLKKPFHDIEVLQLASTLARKWTLARQAAIKMEQADRLVAQRTQKLLEIRRRENAQLPELDPAQATGVGAVDAAEPGGSGSPENDFPVLLLIEEISNLSPLIRPGLAGQYSVLEATGAAQGIAKAKENVPDLIVVDADDSKSDPMKLCATLKKGELTSHIPVILLATDGSDAHHVRALEAGADEFLAKPLRLPLLKAHLDNLLENRRKLHEHFQSLPSIQPRELATNHLDAEFLRRVVEIAENNLADYEFDVEKLARQMAVSRRQLFRKFKAVAGCTPNVFIRNLRLKRAAHLLRESNLTISEIIYNVGFVDLKHFRTIFRERFGVLPGEYQNPMKPSD